MAGVNRVDGSEIGRIDEPNRGLHDLGQARSGRLQDGGKVFQRLLGLPFDSVGERLGGWVDSDLPRTEDEAAAIDRLAVGANRRWCIRGRDSLSHCSDGSYPSSGPSARSV